MTSSDRSGDRVLARAIAREIATNSRAPALVPVPPPSAEPPPSSDDAVFRAIRTLFERVHARLDRLEQRCAASSDCGVRQRCVELACAQTRDSAEILRRARAFEAYILKCAE